MLCVHTHIPLQTSILAASNSTIPMSIGHRVQVIWLHKVTHARQNHKTWLNSWAYSSSLMGMSPHHVKIFRKYRNRSLTWCKSGLDSTLCSWATGAWMSPISEASSWTRPLQHDDGSSKSGLDGCVGSWPPEIHISWRIGLFYKNILWYHIKPCNQVNKSVAKSTNIFIQWCIMTLSQISSEGCQL